MGFVIVLGTLAVLAGVFRLVVNRSTPQQLRDHPRQSDDTLGSEIDVGADSEGAGHHHGGWSGHTGDIGGHDGHGGDSGGDGGSDGGH